MDIRIKQTQDSHSGDGSLDFQLLSKFAFRSVSAGVSCIWVPLVKPVSDSVKQRLFLRGGVFPYLRKYMVQIVNPTEKM